MLLLPLMGFLVVFWAVYQQMTSNFAMQVCVFVCARARGVLCVCPPAARGPPPPPPRRETPPRGTPRARE